jgi:hypothetical protein
VVNGSDYRSTSRRTVARDELNFLDLTGVFNSCIRHAAIVSGTGVECSQSPLYLYINLRLGQE